MPVAEQARKLVQLLRRRREPVVFGDLSRFEPIGSEYGIARGTPIDRFYIHKYLTAHQNLIAGKAIEIGEVRYLAEFGDNVQEAWVLGAPQDSRVDSSQRVVVADLTANDVPADLFDCFVCTQTLNVIFDVAGAIRGACTILRPGGVFVGTVAGIAQVSRYDMDRWGDYWRFTTKSMERLLQASFGDDVVVESFGNSLAAQLFLQGVVLEDLKDTSILEPNDHNYQVVIGFRARKPLAP